MGLRLDNLLKLLLLSRTEAGDYTCHAANKHGEVQASVSVAVLFKPECELNLQHELNLQTWAIC